MSSLDTKLLEKIARLQGDNLFRTLHETERLDNAEVKRADKKLLSFSCNDYLGLSQDKRVIKAARRAAYKYGAGSGASRLVTGNNPLYTQLENKLAEVCQTESALVYGSGYMANIGAITALVGAGDFIIADKLSHSCIIEGSLLSYAEFRRYDHNDLKSLESLLSKHRTNYKNCLVITEAVFSMDGDVADIQKISELCEKYNAWLLVDYAHDINHLTGDNDVKFKDLIKMGTLSKAIGSYGGYIAGSKVLIDYLKTSSKSFMFTTGLPPAVLGAATKSLEIIQEEKWRAEKALENAKYFRDVVTKNLDEIDTTNSNSQIVPLIIGGAEDTLKMSEYLANNGYLVHAIRPPTVPVNTSRLRFSFSADHEKSDIDKLTKLLIKYF